MSRIPALFPDSGGVRREVAEETVERFEGFERFSPNPPIPQSQNPPIPQSPNPKIKKMI
jgi:hypothetical protein